VRQLSERVRGAHLPERAAPRPRAGPHFDGVATHVAVRRLRTGRELSLKFRSVRAILSTALVLSRHLWPHLLDQAEAENSIVVGKHHDLSLDEPNTSKMQHQPPEHAF
jgi:hypothetical protein